MRGQCLKSFLFAAILIKRGVWSINLVGANMDHPEPIEKEEPPCETRKEFDAVEFATALAEQLRDNGSQNTDPRFPILKDCEFSELMNPYANGFIMTNHMPAGSLSGGLIPSMSHIHKLMSRIDILNDRIKLLEEKVAISDKKIAILENKD